MKETNRIKLESLKRENMMKKGYIGEYPMNFFSVVFVFESSPSHEQVVEAIERYFNSHYKYYFENFGELPQFIDYKQINVNNYDKSRNNIDDDTVYVKVDFLIQVDGKNVVEHIQREKDFEAWIDERISINGLDADIERFGTEVNTIHRQIAYATGGIVTPKSNSDKMKPFSEAVSKGLENDEVLSVLKVFEKMTYTQRFELYETNPELHDKLSKAIKRNKMKPSSKADAEKIDELFKKTQD